MGRRLVSLLPVAQRTNAFTTGPWLDHTSNFWSLEEHHYAEIFGVCASFKTNDPPLWSGLLSPSARAAALRENRGHCLNCHEDTHCFRQRRHPFINASGCLNPQLRHRFDAVLSHDHLLRRSAKDATSTKEGVTCRLPVTTVTSTRPPLLHSRAIRRCGSGF